MTGQAGARFELGQVVDHRLFGYRGVICDIDPEFQLSEDWYDTVARSRPPKDRPWYQVLPDGADHMTYVAERNLEPAAEPSPVHHPMIRELFEDFDGTRYHPKQKAN